MRRHSGICGHALRSRCLARSRTLKCGRCACGDAAMRQRGLARDRHAIGADTVHRGRAPRRGDVRGDIMRVGGRLLHALLLHRGGGDMRRLRGAQLFGPWPGDHATVAAVVTHARAVVDHRDRVVIDIGHVDIGHVDHGPVVRNMAVIPMSTLPAMAVITVAIVDPAVPADFTAPVTVMEPVRTIVPAPPRRCPQQTAFGRLVPIAVHPVIIVDPVAPCPITRHPQIVWPGQGRLVVPWQRRRGIADADIQAEADLRPCRGRQHAQSNGRHQQPQRSGAAHGNDKATNAHGGSFIVNQPDLPACRAPSIQSLR